ncbi:uncharacterized protein RHIMIDRAFT_242668 [Rhizopus microsporus ATCC 52813]|uniref:Uncharacterized protein n=1 Tax=Rhizopus microsporus ATCC 52813 TaxID=1340429 RepID=A0A2G4SFA5_RHIZD|nr:uncharacterized protein RHIMIDRAFT_242668 [Rhizopus microsporus ATCC 52813]PHZ07461.1 hypothetical protein RHIMIDRAFT_242668 [Rhizopus microsporus ATCC 52813]
MFVGSRGLGVGSRIKGYMRYGSYWKPLRHSLYTYVCITNEHNISQTCSYCFQKLSHPVKTVYKNGARRLRTISDAFVCDNPSCVSVQAKKSVKGRDILSAMATGLSGLATLLFDTTFPQFDPKVSQSNTDKFKTNAASFFTANEDWPAVDDKKPVAKYVDVNEDNTQDNITPAAKGTASVHIIKSINSLLKVMDLNKNLKGSYLMMDNCIIQARLKIAVLGYRLSVT